jgi:signal transduction histidine kinase
LQETKTKGKKVETNTYTVSSYNSDVSIEETNEGDSIEDAIEVLEEPRAPKSKRVQQKQTETVPSMVTNLHLLEAIQVLISGINKLGVKQDKMEERMEEWFDTVVEEVQNESKALQKEVGEVKAELTKVTVLLKSTSASVQQAQAQAQAQQEKRSFAAVAAHALKTPAQVSNRERGVTLSLGRAAATLRGKPLATIKDMA